MFRVSRIECDGREAKRSKDLEAEAGLPGAHVDPVDVVRLVIGAGHVEVARDAGLHGASAGVSRAVRCVPPASPRAQPSSKTHQVIFLDRIGARTGLDRCSHAWVDRSKSQFQSSSENLNKGVTWLNSTNRHGPTHAGGRGWRAGEAKRSRVREPQWTRGARRSVIGVEG